jgi:hypothetical protein
VLLALLSNCNDPSYIGSCAFQQHLCAFIRRCMLLALLSNCNDPSYNGSCAFQQHLKEACATVFIDSFCRIYLFRITCHRSACEDLTCNYLWFFPCRKFPNSEWAHGLKMVYQSETTADIILPRGSIKSPNSCFYYGWGHVHTSTITCNEIRGSSFRKKAVQWV